MELVKKNIHMDRIRAKATDQITLDDDINISDSMPDARTIILDKADVKTHEVKATTDHVSVKGALLFSILYQTDEENSALYCMDGKIPFDEQIYMEGAENTDTINVKWEIEDFSASLINSRKLNVQALVSLRLFIEELYDEETAVELCMEEPAECCRKNMDIAEVAVNKKDIFRVKEEIKLPPNEPNIFRILWKCVQLSGVHFEPMEEKIGVSGEIQLFVLYEGEGEEAPARTFSTAIPVKGSIECHGSRADMFADISHSISHQEVEVRPDFDGEERMFGLELVLDLDIKLYEQEKVDILSDVYGVTKEIEAETRQGEYRRFLPAEDGECRIDERAKIRPGNARMLQLLHCEGNVHIDEIQPAEEEICITGSLDVKSLYRASDENLPFSAMTAVLPFMYTLKMPGFGAGASFHVTAYLEQLSVAMVDSEELDVKAVIRFHPVVFSRVNEEIISDIRVAELDAAKMGELPGIVAYVAREGETLWQIGKRYYVPVARIMEMNNLSSEKLEAGAKLLIVK